VVGKMSIKKALVNSVDWLLYRVISDKRREKLSNMISDEKKDKIKQLVNYGTHRAAQMEIKQLKNHLYTLGFEKEALKDLKTKLNSETKANVKWMIAWEIALYYANQYTKEDAQQALHYVRTAKEGEKNRDQIRRLSIIEAESLAHLNRHGESYQVIQEALSLKEHPDLYLACANLEKDPFKKIEWLNKAYELYGRKPITFRVDSNPTYDDIRMKEHSEKIDTSVKVSIILPAYNAEDGIQIAIESILEQTWTNIELIIVDDCSTDETKKVIKTYAEKDDRIKVYSTPGNSGPYVARNIGLQAAKGKYVTINDADDWSHEQKIEVQVRHLEGNNEVIANTSGHARLTEEDLQFYRRGTPGKFIFPNMSSIMFRRELVLETIGYWNCVRFAADGEFKRRLIKAFGKEKYVDLDTGPMSLPRQSVSSLTSSSAFGYNGYFMGARKEYVESLTYYHEHNPNLKYPYPQEKQLFPVPRPMWPNKLIGERRFDIIIIGDFRLIHDENELVWKQLEKLFVESKQKIGLVQVYYYDLIAPLEISNKVREYIDGDQIEMTVYGENVEADEVLIIDPEAFNLKQTYIPSVKGNELKVILNKQIDMHILQSIETQLQQEIKAYIPLNDNIRHQLELKQYTMASQNWVNEYGTDGR